MLVAPSAFNVSRLALGQGIALPDIVLAIATLLAFAIGSVLGALLAWPNTGRLFSIFVPVLMTLSAIPYYLLGLVLIYLLAARTSMRGR